MLFQHASQRAIFEFSLLRDAQPILNVINVQGGPKVVTQTFGLIAQRFVAH